MGRDLSCIRVHVPFYLPPLQLRTNLTTAVLFALLPPRRDRRTGPQDGQIPTLTGFEKHDWWDRHKKLNRHHLLEAEGIPEDVNLVDVLDMIADCVMAGMARSGSVYPVNLSSEILVRAFQNTVDLLKAEVVVSDPITP